LGDAYTDNKQVDSALMLYARAYKLQPQNLKIVSVYTDNLLDKQLYQAADSVLRIFQQADSSNVVIMKLGIRSATEQDKMTDAAAFTSRWIHSGEIDPATSAKLAIANYSIQKYETCYLVCDTLLSQGFETESLLYYASKAMSKLNNYIKSNELLRRCLDLAISKNTNVYYFSLADNFETIKNYKKAIAAYDTAYYLFKNSLALYNIGRLYELGMDNKSLAEQYYRKYLSAAKPTTKDERKVYAYVKKRLALRTPSRK
jgi:tetratricopeptide (TPR) repeat protein